MGQLLTTAKQMLFPKKKGICYQLYGELAAGDWEEYPRPQLRRPSYQPLNGMWTVNEKPIRIPFAPQSVLSEYDCEDPLKVPEELLYSRSFTLSENLKKGTYDRILLHFGAVDQVAQVFVNGKPLGTHRGGYLPFTIDITDFLREGADAENQLDVFVTDHLDHFYPWGKQSRKPGGMWYTPVSGIWQSVWLEAVPEYYIRDIRVTPMAGHKVVIAVNHQTLEESFHLELSGAEEKALQESGQSLLHRTGGGRGEACFCDLTLPNGQVHREEMLRVAGQGASDLHQVVLDLDALSAACSCQVREWSPEDPYLYRFAVTLGEDRIESYFGLRVLETRSIKGRQRFFLNGSPIYLHGVLDQGYYSDGLYLPAQPKGYRQDICCMQEMGFNMLRKHIKVEPELFYYYCDQMGMLVMQDMVNSGPYSFLWDTALPTLGFKVHSERRRGLSGPRARARMDFWLDQAKQTQDLLYSHPCLIAYTIFNEGWGQFDSRQVGEQLRSMDPTRMYDFTSGWFAHGGSDVESIHEYFHPGLLAGKELPLFLSECGGYTWMVPQHSYREDENYGYGACEDGEKLTRRIREMYETMVLPSLEQGLCGSVYTQLSDVEEEVNGLITFDRRIPKADTEEMKKLSEEIFQTYAKCCMESSGNE